MAKFDLESARAKVQKDIDGAEGRKAKINERLAKAEKTLADKQANVDKIRKELAGVDASVQAGRAFLERNPVEPQTVAAEGVPSEAAVQS